MIRIQNQLLIGILVIIQIYFVSIWSTKPNSSCNCVNPPVILSDTPLTPTTSENNEEKERNEIQLKKYKVAHFDESHWIYFYGNLEFKIN